MSQEPLNPSQSPFNRFRRRRVLFGVLAFVLLSGLYLSSHSEDSRTVAYVPLDRSAKSALSGPLRPLSRPLRHPNMLASHTPQGRWPASMDGLDAGNHPIVALLQDAQEKWTRKLEAQSSSLKQAKAVYVQKYGKKPPRGFEEWYRKVSSGYFRMVLFHSSRCLF